jgi:hypothetical protein
MAKAGRQTSKKRARQPRRQLRFALDEVFPQDKADALRRWLADEKTTLAAARKKAKQLDAGRREIDRYIAIRDNQMRPPWRDAPARRAKPKRKAKQKDDRHQFDYLGVRAVAGGACKEGIDDRPGLFYDRVRGLCALHQPRIQAPPDRRTMGRYVGDIYRNAKRAARKRRHSKR